MRPQAGQTQQHPAEGSRQTDLPRPLSQVRLATRRMAGYGTPWLPATTRRVTNMPPVCLTTQDKLECQEGRVGNDAV